MIGSAVDIDFNTFLRRMGGVVLAAWLAILLALRLIFRKELATRPEAVRFAENVKSRTPGPGVWPWRSSA